MTIRLSLSALLIAGMLGAPAAVLAQGAAHTAPRHAAKKTAAKAPQKKEAAPASTDPDDAEPDIGSSVATDYSCELGNRVTIYANKDDDQHVALRWKSRLHRMTRVGTTTGANRFENKKFGLVWLGIPAKGILLDSKHGQQLANECRDAEQRAAQHAGPAAAPDALLGAPRT